MNIVQAIEKREELLVEQRKLNLAIKVISSDTCPMNAGIRMAISQYKKRINEIDSELKTLADSVTDNVQSYSKLKDILNRLNGMI